jgi:hypothetical protein
MDAGRLLQVVAEFVAEVTSIKLQETLSAVASSLQQSMQVPNQPTHEQNFKDGLSRLRDALNKCQSNSWTPSKRLILEQAGLATATGVGLGEKIAAILTRGSVIRQPILNELHALVQEVQQKIAQATQATSALAQLGVKPARPPAGMAEIGFLLPDAIHTESIEDIGRELKVIDQILRTLAELHGEAVASAVISDINRGSLEVFAVAPYLIARALLDLAERVLNIWQRIIDLRRQQAELEKNQVPAGVLEVLKAHIDERLTNESAALAHEIVSGTTIQDEGRKNELETQLKYAIKNLAARIDRGAKVEASVLLEASKERSGEPNEEADIQRDIATRGALMAATPQLERPILALTLESENPDGAANKQGDNPV